MKKILLLLLSLMVAVSCATDSNENATAGDGQGGSLAVFALKDNYLYVVDETNLNVFSLADAANPTQVNTVHVGFEIETLFADDNRLYMGARSGMYMYNIENPEDPQLLGTAFHFTACDPVVANGNTAYVTLHSNTWCGNNVNALMIYDITDPEHPATLNSRTLVAPKGLALYRNYLLVCDDKIKIFDVTTPAYPVLKTSIDKVCNDLIIRGNEMFAIADTAVYRFNLDPVDITNIQQISAVQF